MRELQAGSLHPGFGDSHKTTRKTSGVRLAIDYSPCKAMQHLGGWKCGKRQPCQSSGSFYTAQRGEECLTQGARVFANGWEPGVLPS